MLRAIFVKDWNPDEPVRPFGTRKELEAEAKAVRPNHNFAPDGAIRLVAGAVRRHVDEQDFERSLASLPPEARSYWSG